MSTNELVKLLLKKVNGIEDHLVKIDVKIDFLRSDPIPSAEQSMPLKTVDYDELKKLGLPAKSKEDIKELDTNLKNPDFKTMLVTNSFQLIWMKLLCYANRIISIWIFILLQTNVVGAIGGVNGSEDGCRVLEKLVHSLIDPLFLPNVSWTGRGKGKERKVSLCGYSHLINFIVVTVNKADTNFTEDKVNQKLKYTILKHAPSKFGKFKVQPVPDEILVTSQTIPS